MDISVVIPIYGCRAALEELHRRLTDTLVAMDKEYEIILVNDNCPQNSWEVIQQLCKKDKHVVGIELSRNFGQIQAITAGLDYSKGAWVVVIAMSACTDSNYASQYQLPGTFAPTASYELVARAVEVAKEQGTPVRVGSVVSSDVFYGDNPESSKAWRKMGVLCVEMECETAVYECCFA